MSQRSNSSSFVDKNLWIHIHVFMKQCSSAFILAQKYFYSFDMGNPRFTTFLFKHHFLSFSSITQFSFLRLSLLTWSWISLFRNAEGQPSDRRDISVGFLAKFKDSISGQNVHFRWSRSSISTWIECDVCKLRRQEV